MISSRSIKRDAAPENAKPTKNATNAAVDARTRATCRSKGSSAERISEPSQKPSSWAATTPAIRPNATSSSVIRGPLSQSRALGVHDSLDATLTHRFHKGAVVALRLVGIFDRELAHCVVLAGAYVACNHGGVPRAGMRAGERPAADPAVTSRRSRCLPADEEPNYRHRRLLRARRQRPCGPCGAEQGYEL